MLFLCELLGSMTDPTEQVTRQAEQRKEEESVYKEHFDSNPFDIIFIAVV